jgi:hypothetical protein
MYQTTQWNITGHSRFIFVAVRTWNSLKRKRLHRTLTAVFWGVTPRGLTEVSEQRTASIVTHLNRKNCVFTWPQDTFNFLSAPVSWVVGQQLESLGCLGSWTLGNSKPELSNLSGTLHTDNCYGTHVQWFHCHHVMSHPEVTPGDNLQILTGPIVH